MLLRKMFYCFEDYCFLVGSFPSFFVLLWDYSHIRVQWLFSTIEVLLWVTVVNWEFFNSLVWMNHKWISVLAGKVNLAYWFEFQVNGFIELFSFVIIVIRSNERKAANSLLLFTSCSSSIIQGFLLISWLIFFLIILKDNPLGHSSLINQWDVSFIHFYFSWDYLF